MRIKTYLGFDVGTKRTGVAIANSLTKHASGIETIIHQQNGALDWAQIDLLVKQHNVDLFVVGLPLDKNGKTQQMTFIAQSFGRKLTERFAIKVQFIDEYLSSNEAKTQLKYNHNHPQAERSEVDKLCAQLILQTWLNEKKFD